MNKIEAYYDILDRENRPTETFLQGLLYLDEFSFFYDLLRKIDETVEILPTFSYMDETNPNAMKSFSVRIINSIKTMEETTEECIVVLAIPEAYHSNTQKSIALYVYEDSIYKKKGLVGYGCDVYMDGKPVNDKAVAGIYNKAQE